MKNEVSTFRLWTLRGTYLFIVVGLGITIWPGIVNPAAGLSHMSTVVRAMLGAVALLAALGLRHPLRMLPLLLFELAWKSVWLLAFALPAWREQRVSPAMAESIRDCLLGVVLIPIVLPWHHVWSRYFFAPKREPGRAARARPAASVTPPAGVA